MSDSITLEQYSEKSVAVFGSTEKYKDNLMTLGGKYNSNLRGRPGWIFTNSARPRVEEFVKSATSGGDLVVIPPATRTSISTSTSGNNDIIASLLKRIEALELVVYGKQTKQPVKPSTSQTSVDDDCEAVAPKRLLRKQ